MKHGAGNQPSVRAQLHHRSGEPGTEIQTERAEFQSQVRERRAQHAADDPGEVGVLHGA
jgi:hypothetical protein